jgi:thiamine pyrophosphate-dependent acetolactate synthase large subunit-like protein
VHADAAAAADACRRLLDLAAIPASTFRAAAQRRLDCEELGWRPALHDGFTLASALHTVSRSLPAERTVAYDAGRFLGEAFKYFEVDRPRAHVFSSAFGAIGLGMGAAIGAASAVPDEITLLITGDGGFMMSGLNELHSAVRAGLRLVVLVCNDGSYGAEYQQFVAKDLDPALSMFPWPDLSGPASALGCRGLSAYDEKSLASALSAAVTETRPVLIDLKLDTSAVPAIQH